MDHRSGQFGIDFLTFYMLPQVLHGSEALFHTGWFIEYIATQVLVIFVMRTRRNPLHSRPNPWLIGCSAGVVGLAVLSPYTPAAAHLGFVPPPAGLFPILLGMVITYLVVVEMITRWFFRRFAPQ
jgi:P-type Mg2+ transporter